MERNLGVFQYSLLAVICLTSTSLAFAEAAGQGGLFPALLSIPIGFVSLVFTDRKGVLVLPTAVASFFGFVALIASGIEFTLSLEGRILSAAHLITYFQWIFLLQRKTVTVYWWIFALCLLQVAVSSVLTNNAWFGVGLLAFLFLGIWTLANFSIYRARLRVGKPARKSVSSPSNGESPTIPASRNGNGRREDNKVSAYLRPSRSTVRGSIHVVPGESWINARFVVGTILLTCLSTFIGFSFYVATPRVWLGKWQYPSDIAGPANVQLSGFSETVTLGEMGSILESSEPVFTVVFRDGRTRQSLNVEQVFQEYGYVEPLFRGESKELYEDKSWTSFEPGLRNDRQMRFDMRPGRFQLQQDYEIEDIGTEVLFAMHPVVGGAVEGGRARTRLSLGSDAIKWPRNFNGIVADYTLLTPSPTASVEGHAVVPILYGDTADYYRLHEFLERLSRLPENGLERLEQFAQGLVRAEEQRRQSQLTMAEKAFLLERHLRDSGDYGYTLDQTIIDDTIDPVEDFLFNRKAGHCQYYAATLALMLRAVDVPSRYINGFKGGTWKEATNEFEVQQKHAHAWVEAFDPAIPGWIVLDPTPAGRNESLATINDEQDPVREAFGLAQNFWRDSVVNINLQQQQRQIYNPILERIQETWNKTKSTRLVLFALWEYVVEVLTSPDKLLSLQGLTLLVVLIAVLGLLAWLIPTLYRRVVKSGRKLLFASTEGRTTRIVEFYERFVKLLKLHDLQRDEHDTPREFARSVEKTLQLELDQGAMPDFPSRITEAYYSVRFGERTMPEHIVQEFGHEIDRLGLLLKNGSDN